ncbi:Solute carrier family 25 member 40 [Camelus dromedarius]|uniref:Mitochondrial glutathione transporter SLC25A39 n=1 Tax=Camelus dromedarius TaxID=9838 RepID=A0A5N4DYG3_CAMDR|nr:Solute carrier family 25 member 40 [Camelus dromedarius]KAB1276201.1 Solute carrier family 25 member 40 [Camelus dromedarius]
MPSRFQIRDLFLLLLQIFPLLVKNMDPEAEGPPVIKVTPLQQMLASCTGAILTSLMVTPFDVVKIRLQAQNNPFSKDLNITDAFLKIIRNEGIKSLWSGLPPTL